MSLLTACLLNMSGQRLAELTNPENPGGLRVTTIAGTVTVTNGSAVVTGSGTTFTAFGANIVVQFSAQPGVNYIVQSVDSATQITLTTAYYGLTSAGGNLLIPSINYALLQQCVYFAQAHFQARTNFAFDNVTADSNTTPLTLNKCIWAGIALVTYYLYEARAHAWPDAQVQAALSTADRKLELILTNSGDGAFASPQTDSVFQPSVGPVRLPNFDTGHFGTISPWAPGPAQSLGGSGTPNDWNGG